MSLTFSISGGKIFGKLTSKTNDLTRSQSARVKYQFNNDCILLGLNQHFEIPCDHIPNEVFHRNDKYFFKNYILPDRFIYLYRHI